METNLRFATTEEEKEAVYRLRYELYVEDQGLFLDEADHARRWLTDDYDADSPIAIAEIDGQLVGTIRLTWGGTTRFSESTRRDYDTGRFEGVVDEQDIIIVSRLLVRPELRGGPLGCQLFCKVFEFAAEHNAELILGTCEIHLVSHYRKLGFRPFGSLANHPTNGILVPIAAVTGDFDYLQKVDAITTDTLRRRTRPTLGLERILERTHEGLCIDSQEQQDADEYRRRINHWLTGPNAQPQGLLGDLSPQETDTLLAKSHVLNCATGDALFLKGHVSRTLFVLLSGSLAVKEQGATRRLTTCGAVVGEVAMLSSHPRLGDAIAGSQGARVLALSYGNLRRILAGNNALAAKLLRFLALGLCDQLAERAEHDHQQIRGRRLRARRRVHHASGGLKSASKRLPIGRPIRTGSTRARL